MRKLENFWKKLVRIGARKTGSFLYKFSKVDEGLLVFQSEGDFWDNARTLYEYMISQGMNENYRIVWFVAEPKLYERFSKKNVEFINPNSFNPVEVFYAQKIMRSARFFFFTHNGYAKKKKCQTVVNLWHGGVIMKAARSCQNLYKTFDFQCSTSYAAAERMTLFTGVRKEQVIVNGDCRQDCLFSDCGEKVKNFLGKGYDKYIIGMPTFKKTKDWTDAAVDAWLLPILKSKEDFDSLNNFCKTENVLLILKVHHLEDISFISVESGTNIRVLRDDDLQADDIQLYELIGKTDALLTDFSSVAYDYMLLDKPIGYMVSGIQDYKRGFINNNITDEMAGEKISSIADLEKFIREIKRGTDGYQEKRRKIVDKFFIYKRDGNCERLLKILGLTR